MHPIKTEVKHKTRNKYNITKWVEIKRNVLLCSLKYTSPLLL